MAVAGNKNSIYIKPIRFDEQPVPMDGTTGVLFEGLDNSNWQEAADMLETSTFGADFKSRIPGLKDVSLTVSGNYVDGQEYPYVGQYVYVGIYRNGENLPGKQALFILESVEFGADASDKQTVSFSFQGAGELPERLPPRTI